MAIETVLISVGEGDKHRLEEIAATAIDVAGPAGASVELAHVFTESEYESARSSLNFDDPSEVTPRAVAKRYVTIREIGNRLEDAGVEYSLHGSLTNGTPESERILDLATDVDADMIIVGGKKRSPTGKAVFGSTAQEVLLNSPCPVTFVRGE